ncbi:CDP-alcohol phosphatidyltransferase family protein [Frigidibacter oleivorans]|uniref:CDP-alcohol phosphatidyltransferase family protein n=1 Tax=Frigidibacter oleivorans TaxID=2487129 RepID=UPI001F36AA3F|nr:CDP-alcohol phosphatidyltransferase family protein [Frigidibacter oleivorans]
MATFPTHPLAAFSAAPALPALLLLCVAGAGLTLGLAEAMTEAAPRSRAGALALFLGAAALAVRGIGRGRSGTYPHGRLGLCNAVTLTRAALAASLLAPALAGTPRPGLCLALTLVALALDGVDGWLARQAGLASRFGARFDMETDSLLALVLALLAMQTAGLGPWVLVLGLPRYVFWAAMWVWPWLDGPLPPRRSRRWICVVQIGALAALQLPGLWPAAAALAVPLAAGALALVLWSFAVDIRRLAKARG